MDRFSANNREAINRLQQMRGDHVLSSPGESSGGLGLIPAIITYNQAQWSGVEISYKWRYYGHLARFSEEEESFVEDVPDFFHPATETSAGRVILNPAEFYHTNSSTRLTNGVVPDDLPGTYDGLPLGFGLTPVAVFVVKASSSIYLIVGGGVLNPIDGICE